MKPKKFESSMAKMRLLPEDQYQDWKNHKCNQDKVEKVDMLNKKYSHTTLDNNNDNKINENIKGEEFAEQHLKADSDVQSDSISMRPIFGNMSSDNASALVSNSAESDITSPEQNIESPQVQKISEEQLLDNSANDSSEVLQNKISQNATTSADSKVDEPMLNSYSSKQAPLTITKFGQLYDCVPRKKVSSVIQQSKNSKPKTVISKKLLKVKNAEKPYLCTKCDKSFTTVYNLNRHLNTLHSAPRNTRSRSKLKYDIDPAKVPLPPEDSEMNEIPLPFDSSDFKKFNSSKRRKLNNDIRKSKSFPYPTRKLKNGNKMVKHPSNQRKRFLSTSEDLELPSNSKKDFDDYPSWSD